MPLWGYFCQISDSTTSYGIYSGAVPNEKITWGKLGRQHAEIRHRVRRHHRRAAYFRHRPRLVVSCYESDKRLQAISQPTLSSRSLSKIGGQGYPNVYKYKNACSFATDGSKPK